jgi:YVTN family beta-propeller protein/probable HAF family extracellular repeat protein
MLARLTKRVAFLTLVIVLAAGTLASQTAPAQNFITVDYPGGTYNTVRQINVHGEMGGRYIDAEGVYHGFIVQNGVFTPINFPGSLGTAVWGINDNGDLVGRYADAQGITNHGFLFSNNVFTTIDPPGTTLTYAEGVNSVGQIVGFFTDAKEHTHGFLLSAGVYSTIDFPKSIFTNVLRVDNAGAMVGYYDDSSGNEHGFLFQNGTFTSFDYPGAFLTDGYGINNGGQIVGAYEATATSNPLGFEDINGTFTTIDFPAAVGGLLVYDLNDAGQMAGEYEDDAGISHGFVSATGPFAYVANINSNTVSMIDIPTSLPVSAIPVGSGPWGVAVSPDQTRVYVTNNHGNNVSVINTASSTVVAAIQVQSSPFGVVFTPDGTSAYVVNGSSNSVSVIDAASQTVVATVPVQSSPVGVAMAVTSDGTFAYVTNSASNSVSVIAVGSTPKVVKTIPVGSGPRWVAVSPNSSLAYVENAGSNNVSVISVASNTVTATIPVGTSPFGAAFTPDSSTAYVVNSASDTVSVIDTASGSVVAIVAGFDNPVHVALTGDGASAYVTNLNGNDVSVIAAASNTITGTATVGSAPIGVAIASLPPTKLQVTQPLSPTLPNVFNFGTNNFTVQYPAGTSFSNVNMTVTQVEITQAQFQQRVAGTQFANATCIVYAGAGGNCVDDQVTCSESGSPISCPSEPKPTIAVQTTFSTSQAIINPGYLTTPIGENEWKNIFTGFSDPTVKAKTTGFSEFVAIDLGATNPQGAGLMTFLAPLRATDPRVFGAGTGIPVTFQLTSIANPTKPITDAVANLTIVRVSNATGTPESTVVLAADNAFTYRSGIGYTHQVDTDGYEPGQYVLTVYGNAFAAQQVQFTIKGRVATTCVISSSSNQFSAGQHTTFTAHVTAFSVTGVPTGIITFVDSANSQFVLGTAPLVGGMASIQALLQAPPPRQWIGAVYPGDNNFQGCKSPYIPENYESSANQSMLEELVDQ